jgi:hypothetical protein
VRKESSVRVFYQYKNKLGKNADGRANDE